MTVYDQVISIITLYNQGIASSSLPGEAFNILYTYPLGFLSMVGLFCASLEFLSQPYDKRSALKCAAVFIIAFMILSPFTYLYTTSDCNGSAIYRRVGTAGLICGARGLKEISLVPLFDGNITYGEPYYKEGEIIRIIDALISYNIKESVMKSVVISLPEEKRPPPIWTPPPFKGSPLK